MNDTNDMLNGVKSLLIDFAHTNGVNLAAEFGTYKAFRQFVIGFTLNVLLASGIAADVAYDMVFGENAYEALAFEVWSAVHK